MPDISDPDYRLLVETARSWGVPLSVFLGVPTVSVCYGSDGSTATGTVETPGWLDSDRDVALELARYERSLCSSCRNPMSETADPENEFKYYASEPIRCHFCTAALAGQDKAQDHQHPSALHIPVRLRSEGNES